MAARVNFPAATKVVIAKRAAYRCSFPNCNRLTIGPGVRDDQVENTGHAAHIYSASESGPRGQGVLTPTELASTANGMWACATHSSMIDANSGLRYPAATLQSWKALHEFRVAQEHSGRGLTLGFIRSIKIRESPLFEADSKIELAKTTFFVGMNGAGKTALCEWISAIDSPRHLERWANRSGTLDLDILFVAPGDRVLTVQIENRKLEVSLDTSRVAFNHIRIPVIFLRVRRDRDDLDDLEKFAVAFHIDPLSVRSVATFISTDSMFLSAAEFVETKNDEGRMSNDLQCTMKDGTTLAFQSLSGSEQGRVLLDFAVAQIRNASQFTPALLMVEFDGLGIGWNAFAPYMSLFASSSSHFQTIITTHTLDPAAAQLGWQVYRLERLAERKGTIRSS